MRRLVYYICGAIVLFVGLLLINQISPFNLANRTDQKELKTEQVVENEVTEINVKDENEDQDQDQENDSKEASGSSTAPISGSSFKHEVQMDIDGVVEENQDEGWWLIE